MRQTGMPRGLAFRFLGLTEFYRPCDMLLSRWPGEKGFWSMHAREGSGFATYLSGASSLP
jgi:hypothetical protein